MSFFTRPVGSLLKSLKLSAMITPRRNLAGPAWLLAKVKQVVILPLDALYRMNTDNQGFSALLLSKSAYLVTHRQAFNVWSSVRELFGYRKYESHVEFNAIQRDSIVGRLEGQTVRLPRKHAFAAGKIEQLSVRALQIALSITAIAMKLLAIRGVAIRLLPRSILPAHASRAVAAVEALWANHRAALIALIALAGAGIERVLDKRKSPLTARQTEHMKYTMAKQLSEIKTVRANSSQHPEEGRTRRYPRSLHRFASSTVSPLIEVLSLIQSQLENRTGAAPKDFFDKFSDLAHLVAGTTSPSPKEPAHCNSIMDAMDFIFDQLATNERGRSKNQWKETVQPETILGIVEALHRTIESANNAYLALSNADEDDDDRVDPLTALSQMHTKVTEAVAQRQGTDAPTFPLPTEIGTVGLEALLNITEAALRTFATANKIMSDGP